jgi:hypothetical protein
MRVQRTRVLLPAVARRSPLTRRPLGRRACSVAVALLWAVSCTHSRGGLGKVERELAGPNAVDCGEVRPGEKPEVVDRCAVEAFRAGRPFVARYYNESIDSTVAIVLIGKSGGGATRVYYDSAPCGGPGCSERIVQKPCLNPYVVHIQAWERVTCD